MIEALLRHVPGVTTVGPGCETAREGLLGEPVAAVTSLAFVAAAWAIPVVARRARRGELRAVASGGSSGVRSAESAAQRRGRRGALPPAGGRARNLAPYMALVAAVGVGSVIQHGPDPAWSDVVHDTPLAGTLAFVAADAVADRLGRPRSWWWWAAPTAALVPVIALAPGAADLAQAAVAAVAVGLTLGRARSRPLLRRRIAVALGLLVTGAAVGTLSRAGWPLCVPESVWQGHGAWHVLAAAALVVLAPVIGRR